MNEFIADMRKTREVCAPLLVKWMQRLCPEWRIRIEWHYDRPAGYFDSAMWVTCDWRYLHACVNVNLPRLCALPEEEYEPIVVHEVTHILLSEMREWKDASNALDHEERVVTVVSRLLLGLQ